MGVPSFFRWLIGKYPNIVADAKEEKGGDVVDSSMPNPNEMEFDNFYLDMNGIIHPCFHPQEEDVHGKPPATFDQVFELIFEYIDRLFSIVRPRKLLYIAIDGVAPRAKMNQQRARRFRAAKDAEISGKEEDRLRILFRMQGKQVLPKEECEVSDWNVITPGTEFMHKLSKELQQYICMRIKKIPAWKDIKVILSDANVPGEGEHKIMSFIRLQRTFPQYDPNTRHCVYGLDADLIMLVLATHEVHFSVLREYMRDQNLANNKSAQESPTFESKADVENSRGWFKQMSNHEEQSSSKISIVRKAFQFLHIWILREYLELDLAITDPLENFKPDFERIVDDFVFMCFFNGNDFLPHMPSLEMHEGAVNLLLHVYKTEFKNLGGYLVDMQRVDDTKAGYIKLKRVEKFILLVGSYEEKIFQKRFNLMEKRKKKWIREHEEAHCDEDINMEMNELSINSIGLPVSEVCCNESGNAEILRNTKELKEKLTKYTQKEADLLKNGRLGVDKVRYCESGHKERYYKEKFGAVDTEQTRKLVVEKYTEGLCWVLLYYYSGVSSWTWFYPFHYGPFTSDLRGLSQVKLRFQKGLPFKPFDQLMGVLPPRSSHALPVAYQQLMTVEDSSITDFYPQDFEVDVDGKRFLWQGICKLPFIEEARLLVETKKLESELKGEEVIRNSESLDQLFVGQSNKLASQIMLLYKNQKGSITQHDVVEIEAPLSGEINGFLCLKGVENAADFAGHRKFLCDDYVLCVFYKTPRYKTHIPHLLEGVELPVKTISETNIEEVPLWHEYPGSWPPIPLYSQMKNPDRQRKTISDIRSANLPSFGSREGDGVGWSGGRGRGRGRIVAQEDSLETSDVARERMRTPYSSSQMGSGKSNTNFASPANRGMSNNSNEKWKPSGFGRGGSPGLEETKSYGRATPSNNVWRPSERHNTATSHNGHGALPPNQSSNGATAFWSNQMRGEYDPYRHNQSLNAVTTSWSNVVRGECNPWRPSPSHNTATSHNVYGALPPNQSSNGATAFWSNQMRGELNPWRPSPSHNTATSHNVYGALPPNQSSNGATAFWSNQMRGERNPWRPSHNTAIRTRGSQFCHRKLEFEK